MAFGPIMRFTVGDLRIELAPFAKSDMGEFISLEYGGGMWQFSVRKYTGRTNAPTLEDEEEHYEKVRKAIDRLVWGIWVITVIDGTEQRLLIGVSDLFGFDEGGTKLIQQATSGSMIFNKEYWGKGIASAAHKARTWYAFTQLGLHRIKSAVLQANIGSRKALERSGYTFVYTERNESFIDGQLQHLDCLECLNPNRLFWSQWWGADRPDPEKLAARKLTQRTLAWAEKNVELA